MHSITEVENQKDNGGAIVLSDGTRFIFGIAPEPIFRLGGCRVFYDDKHLVLADCIIGYISGDNILVFVEDQEVFRALQEYHRRGKEYSDGKQID